MSVPELKRCFECGATHPPEVLLCPNDGTPLCFDTVGRRWKIEEFFGRRPGGAVFAGFHLVTGQRGIEIGIGHLDQMFQLRQFAIGQAPFMALAAAMAAFTTPT